MGRPLYWPHGKRRGSLPQCACDRRYRLLFTGRWGEGEQDRAISPEPGLFGEVGFSRREAGHAVVLRRTIKGIVQRVPQQ